MFYTTAISIFAPLHWLFTHAKEWNLLPGNWLHMIVAMFSYLGDVYMQTLLAAWNAVHFNGFVLLIFFAVLFSSVIWQYLEDDYKEKGTQTREKQVTRVCTRIIAVVGWCSGLTICLIKGLMIASTISSRERPYGLRSFGLPYMPLLSPHRYYQVCTVLGGVFATLLYTMAGCLSER